MDFSKLVKSEDPLREREEPTEDKSSSQEDDGPFYYGDAYDPLPDAEMPQPIDPLRVAELEGKVSILASRCAIQRRALGDLLRRALPLSDKGQASWYRAAQAAHRGTDPTALDLDLVD